MVKRIDPRLKKCLATNLDENICLALIHSIDRLDDETTLIWQTENSFANDMQNYEKLDKVYTLIQNARDYLRDIIGDVD